MPAPPPSRPRLLAQNRKLRHLQGLALRNLSVEPRSRHAHSVDDASVALRSSPRIAASPPSLALATSCPPSPSLKWSSKPGFGYGEASSSSAAPLERAISGPGSSGPGNAVVIVPTTPMRSRSFTLSSHLVGPRERQAAIRQAVDRKLADVFFSLHCDGEDDPLYVSEVIERSMNFNFGFFNLSHHSPTLSRSPLLTIKIWVRQREWRLLSADRVDLRALHFLGDDRGFHFPTNSLIFHLVDGVYSLDLCWCEPADPRPSTPVATSSYTALMRLVTLENSLQDVLVSQADLTAQVDETLARTPVDQVPLATERATLAAQYLARQGKLLRAAQKRRDDAKACLDARRLAVRQGRAAQERATAAAADWAGQLAALRQTASQTQAAIRGQRRRICSDLADIFPITSDPVHPAALSFQICGLSLPNSSSTNDHRPPAGSLSSSSSSAVSTTVCSPTAPPVSEDTLSAALGLVALLADELQYYLSLPLPYPVTALGSRSTIRDDISLLPDAGRQYTARSRDFPLHLPRGGSTAAHFRFQYGCFLLNKDIEALCGSQGLRLLDIRHTLPNLKYLLYVGSAGSAQIPARLRGGVRALAAAAPQPASSTTSSRASSSHPGRGPADPHSALDGGEASDRDAGSGDGLPPAGPPPVLLPAFALPFAESETKLTLRTKGLREQAIR